VLNEPEMGNCKSSGASATLSTSTSNHTAATRGDDEDADIPNSLVCVVCYSLLATSTSFSCGHTLCWTCAEKWLGDDLDEGARKGCPECRQPVGELRRCIALDHLAAEVAARWPAGSLRLEQWEQARDAGLALASRYAERHAAKRTDAQQSETFARLGIRRGWGGEPQNGLTPYGVTFNETYENDDTFFDTAPFAPFLMPRQGTSVPFGTSSSEASSSDEEEEYHDDALELQEDTDTVLPSALRWMNENLPGSAMSGDDVDEDSVYNSSSEDEAVSPTGQTPSYRDPASASSFYRMDPEIRRSTGGHNVYSLMSRVDSTGGSNNNHQVLENTDSAQTTRTTAAATAADHGPEGLRGFLGLFVQQNDSNTSTMRVTAGGGSSSSVEASLELLFDVMEVETADSSAKEVLASNNATEGAPIESVSPDDTGIMASTVESHTIAESAAASAAAAAASVAAVVKLSWDSAGTIVTASAPPAPAPDSPSAFAGSTSLEAILGESNSSSSQPPNPPSGAEATLDVRSISSAASETASTDTRKGCSLCSVAFKAGVVRVRKSGPFSMWAHWRCFAESSLVQVCRSCALEAAHISRRPDNLRLEPSSLSLGVTGSNAEASPLATSEHSSATTPRVRLYLRCDFLDASRATMSDAVDAGVCGPLERTRQRQKAVVASSLDAALTANVACSWLEVVSSGSLWSNDRLVNLNAENAGVANRRYRMQEGEVEPWAAVPSAEQWQDRRSRHQRNALLETNQVSEPHRDVQGAESDSSDDDESRHEPTSATASEEEDGIGLSGDGAQPVAPS